MRRLAASLALALLLAALARAAPKVKGEKVYKFGEKVKLVASDFSSAKAQMLWDFDGEGDYDEGVLVVKGEKGEKTYVEGGALYVWPARAGKFKVRLTAIDFEAKKVERASFTFTVEGDGPKPPDPPGPGPGPAPPGPTPKGDLRVLVVFENSEAATYPATQQSVLYGKAFRDALNARTPLGPDGKTREWRMWDKDVDTSAEGKTWQDLMKRERKSLPWIVLAGDSGTYYEGPLPKTPAEAAALLEKYAPKKAKKTSAAPFRPGDYAASAPLRKAG